MALQDRKKYLAKRKAASTLKTQRETISRKINKAPPAKRKEVFKKLTGTKDYKNLVKNAKPIPKSGARKLLRKFGVPGAIIASILAIKSKKGAKKSTTTKTPGPGNKSNAPNPFTKINPPAKRRGPGRPTMTSMVAKTPTPRNKNVTKRPKRPSKQGSFGR